MRVPDWSELPVDPALLVAGVVALVALIAIVVTASRLRAPRADRVGDERLEALARLKESGEK